MSSVPHSPTATADMEFAIRDRISTHQLVRLQWSLQHAYDNVAHYKKAFDDAGVHPTDLKDLSDLAKFPFTAKKDLRDNYPFGMFAVPQDKFRASTRPREQPAKLRSSVTQLRTSTTGPT